MIKCVIIDDELNSRELLENLLDKFFPSKFNIVAKCDSVDTAIEAISEYKPDLIFLDVTMPDKNGFELFKELNVIDFEVIFTTAFSKFAIDAFKYNAFDFLMKPISHLELISTIKKLDEKIIKINHQKNLMLLLENIDFHGNIFNKIALPIETGFKLVKTSTILYCQADGNYSKVICIDGSVIHLSKALKYIEELLPKILFKRIHKSYLVNFNFVIKFNKVNELNVELVNNIFLPVSTRKKEELTNALLPTTL
jgi:two-component system LytT family response regulator